MDDTDKIVAAILAAGLCAKAGSTEMDDYIANYLELADRLAKRQAEAKPVNVVIAKFGDGNSDA
jgi:hypothetical protein